MICSKFFPNYKIKNCFFFPSHLKSKAIYSVLASPSKCVVQARNFSQWSLGSGFQAFQHVNYTPQHWTILQVVAVPSFWFCLLILQNLFFSLQRISEREPLPSSGGHIGVAGGHLPFVGAGRPVHGKPENEAKHFGADDHGNSNCQADFSCIIPDILSSPAIPGNIADIVELLKNISLMLSENVNREKMQVFISMGLKSWIWACQSSHAVSCFARDSPMKW